jgi:hypothetical protein
LDGWLGSICLPFRNRQDSEEFPFHLLERQQQQRGFRDEDVERQNEKESGYHGR